MSPPAARCSERSQALRAAAPVSVIWFDLIPHPLVRLLNTRLSAPGTPEYDRYHIDKNLREDCAKRAARVSPGDSVTGKSLTALSLFRPVAGLPRTRETLWAAPQGTSFLRVPKPWEKITPGPNTGRAFWMFLTIIIRLLTEGL